MKRRICNPYLPLDEYIPDGEPHVFGNRLYVFGSHDREGGDKFCMLDYTVWSAPLDDLSDWRNHGTAYKRSQDPQNSGGGEHYLYAPDVVKGNDGRFYLYYCAVSFGAPVQISAAVADSPEGPYDYLGVVCKPDGKPLDEYNPFDPAVLNDGGRILLYYGFTPPMDVPWGLDNESPGCIFAELADDMLTLKSDPVGVLPSGKKSAGTGFEGHGFFEAASIRMINGLYYLVYSSEVKHELCYAVSSRPDKDFKYGGVIISNSDIGYKGRSSNEAVMSPGNNHGGLVKVKSKWYIFYHRHTHGTMFSRQGCAEPVSIDENGIISQVEVTTSGLSPEPLAASGTYPAVIACNLWGRNGAKQEVGGEKLTGLPIVSSGNSERFITQITDGSVIGYKYFKFIGATELKLVFRGSGTGSFEVSDTADGKVLAEVPVEPSDKWSESNCSFELNGKSALFLSFRGAGEQELRSIVFN